MSLSASLAALLDATVIYYGRVNKLAAGLKPLVGQVKVILRPKTNELTVGWSEDLRWRWRGNPTSTRYDEENG
jgi:hypothetical protein